MPRCLALILPYLPRYRALPSDCQATGTQALGQALAVLNGLVCDDEFPLHLRSDPDPGQVISYRGARTRFPVLRGCCATQRIVPFPDVELGPRCAPCNFGSERRPPPQCHHSAGSYPAETSPNGAGKRHGNRIGSLLYDFQTHRFMIPSNPAFYHICTRLELGKQWATGRVLRNSDP